MNRSFNLPPGCSLNDVDPDDETDEERTERELEREEERGDRLRDDEMLEG